MRFLIITLRPAYITMVQIASYKGTKTGCEKEKPPLFAHRFMMITFNGSERIF